MSPETAVALEKSIIHWMKNARAKIHTGTEIFCDSCALCKQFVANVEVPTKGDCDGCPVKIRTSRRNCERTPYYRARKAWFKWGDDPLDMERRDAFREECAREIAFLKSLRDPVTP